MTLGCSKNEVISQKISASLNSNGFVETEKMDNADYIIINSCGFIEDALNETIEETITTLKVKKKNSKIILTGCAANLYKDEFQKDLYEADLILNYNDFNNFFKINSYEKSFIRKVNHKNWEYLLISEGCSKKCTYCTIPMIKGPYRSFNISNLLKECSILVENNIEEIILISQDTAYFGKDFSDPGINHLKEFINKILNSGIKKIRILYFNLDSIECEDKFEFIYDIFSIRGVIPYFEIPLQNLINTTLKRMGRLIKYDEIEKIIYKIKEAFKNSVIRTSIITGFPGETENDYTLLKQRLLSLPIDYLNVFAYSDMPEAPSYKLKNKVKNEIAIERRNDLISSFESELKHRLERFIGTEDEIYIEMEDENYYMGRIWAQTPDLDGLTYIDKSNINSNIKKNQSMINKKVKVKIISNFFYDFYGELI